VASKWISKGYPVTTVLTIVDIAKSTYYSKLKESAKRSYSNVGRKIPGFSYTFSGEIVNDLVIQKYIKDIKNNKTSMYYGYRKVTYELRRKYNLKINKKKVRRLMKTLNLLGDNRKNKKTKISRTCTNVKVTGSNQLWQMDIKYSFIAGTKKTAYITSIIDVFDREIIYHSIDLSATGEVAKQVMLGALYARGIKDNTKGLVLRTDNGSQFISGTFEEACLKEEAVHERIPVRSPNYNAFIESYHRYLQEECLKGRMYLDLNHITSELNDYVYRYNNKRIHSSIGYVPPHEYYIQNIS